MAFELWDPFREAVSLRDAMNSLLQESFVRPGSTQGQSTSFALPLDVTENDNDFVVKASLPGIKPDNVQIIAKFRATHFLDSCRGSDDERGVTRKV